MMGGMENRQQEQLDLLAKKALEHDERFDEHDKRFDKIEKLSKDILSLQDQMLALLRQARS